MDRLELLMNREELLRQVEFIVDDELSYVHESHRYNLILALSEKVCEAFPAQ